MPIGIRVTDLPALLSLDDNDTLLALGDGTLGRATTSAITNSTGGPASLDVARIDGIAYVAHRGAPNLHPEETLAAYRAIVAQGAKIIECDVHRLGDGTLGVMHDSTVDRTTSSAGNVASHGIASWKQITVDVGATLGGAWSTYTEPPPTFDELVREFGNKVVIAVEAKTVGSGQLVVDTLNRYDVATDAAVISSVYIDELAPAVADGRLTQFVGVGATPAALVAAGVDSVTLAYYVTPNPQTSQATFDSYRNAGIEVWAHTVNQHHDRDLLIGWGITGFYSDDPIYLSGQYETLTTDPFDTGNWYHGHLMVGSLSRGNITGGALVQPANASSGCFQGWAAPLADPENVVIDIAVKWTSSTTTTNWVAVDIQTNDLPATGTGFSAGCNGYRFLARKNGGLNTYRITGTAATALLSTAGTLIADGATATYRVTITPTHVSFERIDVATGPLSSADATYRGEYVGYMVATSGGTMQTSLESMTIT